MLTSDECRNRARQLFEVDEDERPDSSLLDKVSSIGSPMLPALMEKISDPTTPERRLRVLSWLRDPLPETLAVEIARRYSEYEPRIPRRFLGTLHCEDSVRWKDASLKVVIAFLLEVAHEDDPNVRDTVAWKLTWIGQRAVADLTKASTDPDWRNRLTAARALGQIGAKDCLSTLFRMTDDEDERVRIEATIALIDASQRFAGEELHKCVEKEDSPPEARCRAAEVLKEKPLILPLGASRPSLDIKEAWSVQNRRWAALVNGPSAPTARLLLEGLQDPADPRRGEYASAFGKYGNALLLDGDADEGGQVSMRTACVQALHDGLKNGPPNRENEIAE